MIESTLILVTREPVFADEAKQPVNKLIQLKYVHLLKLGASVELTPVSGCSVHNTNGYYKCITKCYRNSAQYFAFQVRGVANSELKICVT